MAQTDLRRSLETLTRAVETATPLRVSTWGGRASRAAAVADCRQAARRQGGYAHRRGRRR